MPFPPHAENQISLAFCSMSTLFLRVLLLRGGFPVRGVGLGPFTGSHFPVQEQDKNYILFSSCRGITVQLLLLHFLHVAMMQEGAQTPKTTRVLNSPHSKHVQSPDSFKKCCFSELLVKKKLKMGQEL